MTAYIAINGNNKTAKLYEQPLTREQLIAGVQPYATFDAAVEALKPYHGKCANGMIDLGYVKPIIAPTPG